MHRGKSEIKTAKGLPSDLRLAQVVNITEQIAEFSREHGFSTTQRPDKLSASAELLITQFLLSASANRQHMNLIASNGERMVSCPPDSVSLDVLMSPLADNKSQRHCDSRARASLVLARDSSSDIPRPARMSSSPC
jgi:hypothetical protein